MNMKTKTKQQILVIKKMTDCIFAVLFIKILKRRIKKTRYRMNVLKQWIRTEQSYKNDLQLAIKCIRDPLLKKNLIDSSQGSVLCPSFEPMISLSKMMIEVFETQLCLKGKFIRSQIYKQESIIAVNPNKIRLGDKLCSFATGYKTYSDFFGNHTSSEKILRSLINEYPEVMKQIQQDLRKKAIETNEKKENISLKDCLDQPLYRLFKYDTLIKQYLKRLPKNHIDYQSLLRAQTMFRDINNANNEKMRKLQLQEKKMQLQKFLGRSMEGSMSYICEMQAETIEFKVKIYIFNTFVLLSKNEQGIASRQQKFLTIELDEFSFVGNQHDTKYFKHILVLTGANISIHLFFPDQGSRMQLYLCLRKIIKQIVVNQMKKRKRGVQQKKKQKKIKFTLEETQINQQSFLPSFRIQVISSEVRPLTQLTNQTVYITRFMFPEYYSDWFDFLKGSKIQQQQDHQTNNIPRTSINNQEKEQLLYINGSKQNIWICQYIDLHLSVLLGLENQLKAKFPEVVLPELNPITKEINIYSQGRKKTKAFEVRCFFIEQFLNVVFRHPTIMSNPLFIVKLLRIEVAFWEYAVIKSSKTIKSGIQGPPFGFKHCQVCPKADIKSFQEFQHYRNYFRKSYSSDKKVSIEDKYCFNFYNIARMKLLQFPNQHFNTIERVLLGVHYFQGKLDYPFIKRHRSKPRLLKINLLTLDQIELTLTVYQKTTVGEIIEEISLRYNVLNLFDYCLTANYYDRQRFLGNDEYIIDITKQLSIKLQMIEGGQKEEEDEESGIWGSIKQWGKQLISNTNTKIYFRKYIFLNKNLEMKSFQRYPQKCQMFVEQIFSQVASGKIPLTIEELAKLSGLYYSIKEIDRMIHFSVDTISKARLRKIIPQPRWGLIEANKYFLQIVIQTIQNSKKSILNKNTVEIMPLYIGILNIVFTNPLLTSNCVPITVHTGQTLPPEYINENMILGVNYRQIVLFKNYQTPIPVISFPICEIKCTTTTYSIFIIHQSRNYRFDGRMFQNFHQTFLKYQIINGKLKFAQHSA